MIIKRYSNLTVVYDGMIYTNFVVTTLYILYYGISRYNINDQET